MKRVALVFALLVIACTSAIKTTPVRDTDYAGIGGAIRGVVSDRGGTPLPGVTVILHTARGDQTQVTNARGEYQFVNLVPGTYRIRAELSGFGSRTINVNVAEGIAHVHRSFPTLPIFTAAIDQRLNAKGFILPGLGDAGDRLFGV